MMENNVRHPRILVINGNAFSEVTNIGKTLVSFFREAPAENIAQLYFYPEDPGSDLCRNYYRITDGDVLGRFLRRGESCGGRVPYPAEQAPDQGSGPHGPGHWKIGLRSILKSFGILRLLRELVWRSGCWRTGELNRWLEEFDPELIFLCAGDGAFTYDIARDIRERFHTRLVVYITDDYILPRASLSPFWRIRRKLVLNEMKKAVGSCDLFVTISPQMQREYRKIFHRDSIVSVNRTGALRDASMTGKRRYILMVYAGGLHYHRYKTLRRLAKAILCYNRAEGTKQKVFLRIYSSRVPGRKLEKYLRVRGASRYCGSLNPSELKQVLNSCDIPVYVEAFNRRSREATRLSVSTKIPEYLSLGKPILAIGPEQVASMQNLQKCAFCITARNEIGRRLSELLSDKDLLSFYGEKALEYYHGEYADNNVYGRLYDNILKIYNKSDL